MTYLPKDELVGVMSPSSINVQDIGKNWQDLGVIASTINSISYLGDGIVVFGDSLGHVFRSTDYGKTWVDLGVIAGNSISTVSYFGNGIVVLGDAVQHIWRSTDFGLTWLDLGAMGFPIGSISYLGNGIGIAAINGGHILRTTDFGASWVDLGDITGSGLNLFASFNLENGIVIVSRTTRIYISVDYGLTWNIGQTIVVATGTYLGNGRAIIASGSAIGDVWLSANYGATWTDIGTISSGLRRPSYLGNGVIIFGTSGDQHIWRSTNNGLSWTDLGTVLSIGDVTTSTCYLGNGITLIGTNLGHIHRSDVAYKSDESSSAKVASVDTGYYKKFFQNEGTQVNGAWSWVNNVSQTNYSSLRGEGAGWFQSSDGIANEYKWSNLHLGPGLYEIDIVYPTGGALVNFGGIAQVLFGTTSLGQFDEWTLGGFTFNNAVAIQFSVSVATTADLIFKVNGRNGSSLHYRIAFSRFELFKYG